jgi:dihydrofolate reductase
MAHQSSEAAVPKLAVVNFVSLDGVIQSVLSADEDTEGGFTQGGWVARHMDDDVAAFMSATTVNARAMLLGRKTYQGFARVWPSAGEDQPAVAAMNRMPKYIVSRTLASVDWQNSRLLGPDLENEIRHLKQDGDDGEIVVFGSGELIRTLSSLGLIDEYRLLTFPLVLGSGKRMFGEGSTPAELTLLTSSVTATGVLISTYVPTTGRQQSDTGPG